MEREVLRGDLLLFVGQTRKSAKVLYFDGTGLCLLHKRLSLSSSWKEAKQSVGFRCLLPLRQIAIRTDSPRVES